MTVELGVAPTLEPRVGLTVDMSVVMIASYRIRGNTKCFSNVTCHVKRLCDGQNTCDITVNDNLFSSIAQCSGPNDNKELYFEYVCTDTRKTFDGNCKYLEMIFLCRGILNLRSKITFHFLPSQGSLKISTDKVIETSFNTNRNSPSQDATNLNNLDL